jgi:hypothetical protein
VARYRQRHSLWDINQVRANAKLGEINMKNTRGDEDESKSELFGESGKVRRNVDVQLREMSGE